MHGTNMKIILIYLCLKCCTCFRRFLRPSSGAHVHTAYVLSTVKHLKINPIAFIYIWGTAVAQWLRCCATNRKVAGSIPAGVSGFFIDIKSLRSQYGPGVDSASNRNEYQDYFLGVKAAGA